MLSCPTAGEMLRTGTGLLRAAGVDCPEVDARILLAHILNCKLNDLLLPSKATLSHEDEVIYGHLLCLRARRMPLQYVTRDTVFCGLRLRCDDRALVPRQETELLVEAIAGHLRKLNPPPGSVVVDVGCGNGAIALTLATWLPDLQVVATDLSPAALELTAENTCLLGLEDRVILSAGSYLQPVFHLGLADKVIAVVNNPPYVLPEEIPLLDAETLAEPRLAVQSISEDGLEEYREIVMQARDLPQLRLLGVEVGYGQAAAVREILGELGYLETMLDYCDIERHVIAHVQR